MFSKERFPVSRTIPLFPNINGDFIPLGTTHYNTISGSVNRKTQDIVFRRRKTADRKQNIVNSVLVAAWCLVYVIQAFYPGLVVKTTNLEAQTCMDTVVWFRYLLIYKG